jgi:class 3 adenylate cyclase
MSKIALDHGAMIDKYVGDAIIGAIHVETEFSDGRW